MALENQNRKAPFFPEKAMILAAGLGERLRPLTLSVPKPLVRVAGHPILEFNLVLLKKFGIREVLINLHYRGDQIRDFFQEGEAWGVKIGYSEEEEILGTGGGVRKVLDFFQGEPFFLLNGDLLIDVDLNAVFETHLQQDNLATLVVAEANRPDVKNFIFSEDGKRIDSIGPQKLQGDSPRKSIPYIFTGTQLVNPQALEILPLGKKSCIVQKGYLPLLQEGQRLGIYELRGYWQDLGTFERYESADQELRERWPYRILRREDFPSW